MSRKQLTRVLSLCLLLGLALGVLPWRSGLALPLPEQAPTLTQEPEAASPDCALLDDPAALGQMSAGFELRLRVLCGQMTTLDPQTAKLAELSDFLAPTATDVLVNNPGLDIGMSTTQSSTTLAVNPWTGAVCSAYNDSQHYAEGGTSITGFSYSTDDGATFTDGGAIPAGGGGISYGFPSLAWRVDGYFYLTSLHTNGLGLWRSTNDCETFSYVGMVYTGANSDRPFMVVENNPSSLYYGRLYVVWTNFTNGHIHELFQRCLHLVCAG
jgi:hypothetical protein